MRALALTGLLCLLPVVPDRAWGQRRVDERNLGERLVLIVPMQGDGTSRSPRKPLFAPDVLGPEGILSYTSVLSDDGKFALVELVANDRKAFAAILSDTRADVKKFDRSRGAKKEDIEAEFKKYKKDFSFDKFKEGK